MKKIILCSLILLSLFSCKKELEEVPRSFISPDNFYKTEKDAEGAVAGMYAGIMSDNYIMLDLLHSDYCTSLGSWVSVGNTDKVMDATQSDRAASIWNQFYSTINRANVILNRVPQIEGMNEANRTRILAEAYFVRAMLYFELVQCFGALPLRTTELANLEDIAAPRAPLDDVYKLILSDLAIAEKDLPTTVGAQTERASKRAAKMLLANVYLDREKWSEAADKADEVINSGQFTLVKVSKETDFYKIFAVETSSEDIMSHHFSITVSTSSINSFHGAGTPYNKGTVFGFTNVPNMKSFLGNGTWDDNDLRKSFNLYSSYIDANGNIVSIANTQQPVRFKKFIKDPNGYPTYSRPIFRFTEAFLVYAEAATMANGGPTPLALERLNMIKRRAYGYSDLNAPTPVDYQAGMSQAQFRDVVLKERAYEFVLETRRWWDLKRTDTIKQAYAAIGKTYIDARLLFPIPKTEIDNNPALSQKDQNTGY